MSNDELKVAIIQMCATNDKEKNVETIEKLLTSEESKSADLVVLPECCNFRRLKKEPIKVETIPGPTTDRIAALAITHQQYILIGSIFEESEEVGKAYNTSILINPMGDIQATYRKVHLFNAIVGGVRLFESDYFISGTEPQISQIKNFKIGFSICYDLRFPEFYRYYFKNDVDILCIPSSFTSKTGKDHWNPLCKARAIENQSYVLAPNQYGLGSGRVKTYGHSLIINPWGKVIAEEKKAQDKVLTATCKKQNLKSIRSAMMCKNAITNIE